MWEKIKNLLVSKRLKAAEALNVRLITRNEFLEHEVEDLNMKVKILEDEVCTLQTTFLPSDLEEYAIDPDYEMHRIEDEKYAADAT